MKIVKSVLILLFICNFSITIYSATKIAILDFKGIKTDREFVSGITETFITDISKNKSIEVIERPQLDRIIKELKLVSMDDFSDDTAVRIGELAKAKLVLLGSIVKTGNKFIINARCIDIETGKIQFGDNITADSEKGIYNAVGVISGKIIKSIGIMSVNAELLNIDISKLKRPYIITEDYVAFIFDPAKFGIDVSDIKELHIYGDYNNYRKSPEWKMEYDYKIKVWIFIADKDDVKDGSTFDFVVNSDWWQDNITSDKFDQTIFNKDEKGDLYFIVKY